MWPYRFALVLQPDGDGVRNSAAEGPVQQVIGPGGLHSADVVEVLGDHALQRGRECTGVGDIRDSAYPVYTPDKASAETLEHLLLSASCATTAGP